MKKTILIAGLSLFALSAAATSGYPGHSQTAGPETTDVMGGGTPGGQGTEHSETNYQRNRRVENIREGKEAAPGTTKNSQQRMEERQNNSQMKIQSDKRTKSDGRGINQKDTRPQGSEYHEDTSDFDVEEN